MISFSFAGRTALVTGGTRGIGAAVTKAFLQAGATVYAVYRGNDAAAESFKASVSAEEAGRLNLVKADVSLSEDCDRIFQIFGENTLDILVNSAGIRRDSVTAMMKEDDWNDVIQTNLTGTFMMTKRAIKAMMPQRYGRIISLTSPSGRIGIAGQPNYAASKAGISAMTKAAARETARRGITVNAVSPGFIDTDFISALPEDQKTAYKNDVPLKRFGKPEEVAAAILFLASEEASYITGSILEIAGGL